MVTGDFSPANCTRALLKVVLAELSKLLPGAAGLKELISSYEEMERAGKIDAISNAQIEHGKLLTRIAVFNCVTNEKEFAEMVKSNLQSAMAMHEESQGSSGNLVVDYLKSIEGFEYKEAIFSSLAILSRQYSDIMANRMNLALDDELQKDFNAIFDKCGDEHKFVKTPNILFYFYEKKKSIFRQVVDNYFSDVDTIKLLSFLEESIANQENISLQIATCHDLEIVKVAKKFAYYSSSPLVTERHILLAVFDSNSGYQSSTIQIIREEFGDKVDVILSCLENVGRISTNNSRHAKRK